ncbi:ABC transporter permease [Kosmotoga arenicorallina S304]|uniref:ABC transporter permease n=1 Tax=Kosmotoga arenicorallina S304 TaxID=1453497 RepID=A0A176JZF1_9BACT|nr:sugar ABC transporter permease [Kosmotoga arenicorallina]OAA29462.1 ABC transporter permease [Kosmotoga arenicorallina S304]
MKSKKWVPYAFLALPLLMYSIWVIFPIFQTLYLSFTDWDGVSPEFSIIGWDNFKLLFQDPYFRISLWNNIKWLIGFAGVSVPLGLLIAMLLDQKFRGSKVYKTLMYLPMTLSFVVIGQIWSWILEPRYGALNSFLSIFGIKSVGWLSDPNIVTYSLIMAASWRQISYAMVLYLAGLKQVPKELVEAAWVDGANGWKRFVHVILPMLRPATIVAITVSVIDSLRAFDIVYVLTRGGPFYSSSVMANYMYIMAFNNYRMGYGSAIATIQFLITLGFIVFYMRNVLKKEEAL